tara:strand:- start:554 stop:781 length:228 start_codon:yes stop_codon:yes gene_type:complete
MYHVQMKKSFDRGGDKWMSAWEGSEYNTQEEAFDMLDEYLEEAKEDGLEYNRDHYRVKYIEGIVIDFSPEGEDDE